MRNSSNLLSSINNKLPVIKRLELEFSKNPMSNLILNAKKNLEYDSKKIMFDNIRWKHNPQLFSWDQYQLQDLYPIVLLVNNIGSIYQFSNDNIRYIITPDKKRIFNLLDNL